MKENDTLGIGNNGSDSFRRKTDIFNGNPLDFLSAAKNGTVTIQELQAYLIDIKKPENIEKKIIESTEDVEFLVMKILEQGAEIIDYSYDHILPSENEEHKTKIEISQDKYLQAKKKMDDSFSQEIKEMSPEFIEKNDTILISFFYKKEDESISFDVIFSVNRTYSSKITGEYYMQISDEEGFIVICEPFSLPFAKTVIQGGRRRLDVFPSETYSQFPDTIKNGLHEKFIVKMQIYTEEPRKFPQASFLDRLFRKK